MNRKRRFFSFVNPPYNEKFFCELPNPQLSPMEKSVNNNGADMPPLQRAAAISRPTVRHPLDAY
ncbi:MAG TPA: hypothetical protein DEF33_01315 [Clostridiales bacterium]|nr:hypothetical protein [Clostridiales bacterium]